MFHSWVDGLIFGLVATFFTGVLASIVARFNLDNYVKSNTNTNTNA